MAQPKISLIREMIKNSVDTIVTGKKYMASNWLDLMKEVYSKLFSDVGLKKMDVKKDDASTFLRLLFLNGDRIFAKVNQNPLTGEVVINSKFRTILGSKEAFVLPTTIRKIYDEYLKTK